jgi:hypothetical protein
LAEGLDVFCGRPRELGRLAEGFIEGELFEDGHDAADGVEDAAAGHAVDHAARGQHHCGGSDQAARLVHGHRRARAVHAGLVAGTGDHATPAQTADEHGPSAQGGPGQLLDGRIERVHVEMQHPAVHAVIVWTGLDTTDASQRWSPTSSTGGTLFCRPSSIVDDL